jgi:hypothetical protein
MEAQRLYYMLPWRKNDGNRKVEVVSLAFNCSMVCNVAAAMDNDDKLVNLAVCR